MKTYTAKGNYTCVRTEMEVSSIFGKVLQLGLPWSNRGGVCGF